jgi:hypothetical protein
MKTLEEKKEYKRLWNLANKDKISEYNKVNSKKISQQKKNWAKANLEKNRKSVKKWTLANPEKARLNYNASIKKRKSNDPLFKLTCRLRVITSKVLSGKKTKKTKEILGCEFEYFKNYLESKFEPWMTWDNYGKYNGFEKYGWDIDHIIPISSANSEETLIKLCYYTNLQPLCSKINRDIKRNIMLELSMDF